MGYRASEFENMGLKDVVRADMAENAEEMYETKKGIISIDRKTGKPVPKTSHTLNKVPFIIYDNRKDKGYALKEGDFGLANVAATVVNLLGYVAPETWEESMIEEVYNG